MAPSALRTRGGDRTCFLRAAGDVLAGVLPADRGAGSLTSTLCISASLRLAGLDRELDTACRALLDLRRGVLEVGVLDAAHEPVPLVVGDRRRAVLGLFGYLDDLVDRAARAAGLPRGDVVVAALGWLGS